MIMIDKGSGNCISCVPIGRLFLTFDPNFILCLVYSNFCANLKTEKTVFNKVKQFQFSYEGFDNFDVK